MMLRWTSRPEMVWALLIGAPFHETTNAIVAVSATNLRETRFILSPCVISMRPLGVATREYRYGQRVEGEGGALASCAVAPRSPGSSCRHLAARKAVSSGHCRRGWEVAQAQRRSGLAPGFAPREPRSAPPE